MTSKLKEMDDAATDLIYYCDGLYQILINAGYQGKAQALERRYLKLGGLLGLEPKKSPSILSEYIIVSIDENTKELLSENK